MSFFQSLLTDGGYDVIASMGDSISRGNSDAVGATPNPGTVYQWDAGNSNLRMITNLDLLEPVAAGATGSQWPQAGITYHSLTKRRPVFVNTGIGGSAFFNPSAGFSWWTNDTVFSNAVTKINNCLAYLGQDKPKLIWVNMGINDVVQGHALDQQYLTSFIDRILLEWPGVRICMTQPWSSTVNTYANLTRLYQIRKWIKALCFTYPTVEISGDLGINTQWGGNFQADNIHLNSTGNGFLGDKTMYGICQSMSLNKWTRYMTGIFYNRISSTRIGWLDTFINTLHSAGELENIDSLEITSTAGYVDASNQHKNAIQDLGAIGVNSYGSPVANVTWAGYTTAGAVDSDRISAAPLSLIADKANLSSDFIYWMRIAANAVGATTAATQHGVRESATGGIVRIRQTGSSTIGFTAASTTESTNGSETRPANGFYGAARNGGNQILVKDTVEVATAAVAAAALNPGANIRSSTLSNYNNNGTIQERFAGTFYARGFGKYTTMNKTTFVNALNDFLTNWLTTTT